jgi:HEAT repeat protein
MNDPMKCCLRRGGLLIFLAATLAGCGDRETRKALDDAKKLAETKHYEEANDELVAALRVREDKVKAAYPAPTDQLALDDLTKKVQADPEILKMERAQIPLYLHMERPDLASAVSSDILAGDPQDKTAEEMLQDPDAPIRLGAVRILGLTGQPSAIAALARATKDPDQDVRRAAVGALGTIKEPAAVPPLIEALKDSFWFVRSDAADALGRERDGRAVAPLLGMMNDSDKSVVHSAENALVLLASAPGVSSEDFAARVNDPDPKVATVAAVCLAVQKDKRAVPALLKLAASPDAETRVHAVKALGATGDPAGVATLRQLLHDPDVNVRGWSIIGLGKLKDQGSLPDLKAMAADDKQPSDIRDTANQAINEINGTPAAATPGP